MSSVKMIKTTKTTTTIKITVLKKKESKKQESKVVVKSVLKKKEIKMKETKMKSSNDLKKMPLIKNGERKDKRYNKPQVLKLNGTRDKRCKLSK